LNQTVAPASVQTTTYDAAVQELARQLARATVRAAGDTGDMTGRDVGSQPGPAVSSVTVVPSGDESTPDDEQRFFGQLLNSLVPIISQTVPTMLQAIQQQNRDLGVPVETDPESLERDFATVFSGLLKPIISSFPQLMLQLAAPRDTGNPEPTNADDAAQRWLFPLLTTLVPAAAQALPGIINAFTGQRGESVEVSVSDPEIAERFFGPLLGQLASGLVGQLPNIISLFNPPPRELQLNWVNFTGQWLPDGDVVRTVERDLGDPSYVEFSLSQPWGTWWKGVELWIGGQRVGSLEVQDSRRESDTIRVEVQQIVGAGYLKFLKAKMFGVHTGMYHLGGLDQKAGKHVRFDWMHG
jgi:hypothetical protein